MILHKKDGKRKQEFNIITRLASKPRWMVQIPMWGMGTCLARKLILFLAQFVFENAIKNLIHILSYISCKILGQSKEWECQH